jgi:Domain of unknown function (DUF3479)
MQAAKQVAKQCPGVRVLVFSDRDILSRKADIMAALDGADVFFGSLLFDYDQVATAALICCAAVSTRAIHRSRHAACCQSTTSDQHTQGRVYTG